MNTPDLYPKKLLHSAGQKLQQNQRNIWLAILLTLGVGYGIHEFSHKKHQYQANIEVPAELKGRTLNDLYSYYIWWQGDRETLWDSVHFDPKQIIEELYEKKFSRMNSKNLKVAKQFYDETVSKVDFHDVTPITVDQYSHSIRESIKEIQNNFDWEAFNKKRFEDNSKNAEIFKNICKNIDEDCLLAYSMTEFFPSADGKLNKELLSFLLKNWGEKFLFYLPAVHDDYTSFGPYQFTYLALADYNGQKNGASKLNTYLPAEHKIPGSVNKLEGNEHHKAAYLFAIYNISTLMKHPDLVKALTLLTQKRYKNDLAELIAIMHNKPANGKVFLRERYRLQHHKEYDRNKNGKIDMFEADPTDKCSSEYWRKTYNNKEALDG